MAITYTQTNPNDFETVYTYAALTANDTTAWQPMWAGETVMAQITAVSGGTITVQYSLDGVNAVTAQEGVGVDAVCTSVTATVANQRVFMLKPARFFRISCGVGVANNSAVTIVVRRSAEAALS